MVLSKKKILVTGAAGFIGSEIAKKLLSESLDVLGIDNLNDYYDTNLKLYRLKNIKKFNNFSFHKVDISNSEKFKEFMRNKKFDVICHLAAQAGVRYSLINPRAYTKSNVDGFLEVLEYCRNNPLTKWVYASSSSVYGSNTKTPFSVNDDVSNPVSLYAATKRANEIMAQSYSNLYSLKIIGLRFFTVYGPWGRPDMAPFIFTKSIIEGKPIKVLNHGKMKRDFTYIDDIIECIFRLIKKPAISNKEFNKSLPDSSSSWAPFRIFNIGNSKSIDLLEFISTLEEVIGIKAKKQFLPMQPGDVEETFAKTDEIEQYVNFKPNTKLKEGITSFVNWYKNYYKVTN